MPKSTSPRFQECRKLVHEDAFEAKLAAETAIPLISGLLSEMGEHRAVGIFLRRVLMRYLSLLLSRLLDESRNGKTGITASIPSLLEMTREETILSQTQLQHFDSAFEKIKANAGTPRIRSAEGTSRSAKHSSSAQAYPMEQYNKRRFGAASDRVR
jgi:hypothetical protein